MVERKEKREIEKKLKCVKPLGDKSDSDEDIKEWVKKSRLKELEKKQAAARVSNSLSSIVTLHVHIFCCYVIIPVRHQIFVNGFLSFS